MNESNNRATERFDTESPVRLTVVESNATIGARIANCSEDGIYFETESALEPGTDIFVAAENDNKFFRARVIWCKRMVSETAIYFGVGAEYTDPPFDSKKLT